MKKITTLIALIFYDFIMSLIANALNFTVSGEVIQDLPTGVDTNLSSFLDTLTYFGNLLIFQVSGDIPNVVLIIFFYFPNVVIWLLILFIIFNRGD